MGLCIGCVELYKGDGHTCRDPSPDLGQCRRACLCWAKPEVEGTDGQPGQPGQPAESGMSISDSSDTDDTPVPPISRVPSVPRRF
jgi:hypothetical protein